MAKITVIVDNNTNGKGIAEHGLSLWIEKGSNKILFDTGAGNALLHNAEEFKVDLKTLTQVVLSHGHSDHTGGLSLLPPEIQLDKIPIYTGQGITNPCYSLHSDGRKHPLTMPPESQKILWKMQHHLVNNMVTLDEGICLAGPIERTSWEDTGGSFFSDEKCQNPNKINEELALFLDEGILVSGCSHSGIINILEKFRNLLPDKKIRTIIGGLHLIHANEERLEKTANYLNAIGLERIILLHCTGAEAAKYLQKWLNCPVLMGHAGYVLEF